MLPLRSVLDSFGVKTRFDTPGEYLSLCPGVVYDGQKHFQSLGTVCWCTYGKDPTGLQPTDFFFINQIKIIHNQNKELNLSIEP
jgi:hypothetical protein